MDEFLEYQCALALMMCLSVESFCCCISLEVATQVIGIVSTLMSAMIMVLYASAAVLLRMSQTKLVFYGAMGLTSGLQCVFGVLLCYGAFQRRPKYMWPWLVIAWTTGVTLLVISTGGCIALILGGYLTADANLIISAYVIYSLFQLYCAFVVNSRRSEILKEKESESETTTTTAALMGYPAFKYA